MTRKILLIEDDHTLSTAVCSVLKKEGYAVDQVFDGDFALKSVRITRYDLILLDLNLPKINGIDLSVKIRELDVGVPVIVITAYSDIETKLEAFERGVDDYLVKPFHNQELLAKVKVFLRRNDRPSSEQIIYQIKDLTLDVSKKEVRRGDVLIELSRKEFEILEYLLKNKHKIVSKDELAINLWDHRYGVSYNTIEVYINFLRKKIDKDFEQKLILTKTGFGYYLNGLNEF